VCKADVVVVVDMAAHDVRPPGEVVKQLVGCIQSIIITCGWHLIHKYSVPQRVEEDYNGKRIIPVQLENGY